MSYHVSMWFKTESHAWTWDMIGTVDTPQPSPLRRLTERWYAHGIWMDRGIRPWDIVSCVVTARANPAFQRAGTCCFRFNGWKNGGNGPVHLFRHIKAFIYPPLVGLSEILPSMMIFLSALPSRNIIISGNISPNPPRSSFVNDEY